MLVVDAWIRMSEGLNSMLHEDVKNDPVKITDRKFRERINNGYFREKYLSGI